MTCERGVDVDENFVIIEKTSLLLKMSSVRQIWDFFRRDIIT